MDGYKNNYSFMIWSIWNGTEHLKLSTRQDH